MDSVLSNREAKRCQVTDYLNSSPPFFLNFHLLLLIRYLNSFLRRKIFDERAVETVCDILLHPEIIICNFIHALYTIEFFIRDLQVMLPG